MLSIRNLLDASAEEPLLGTMLDKEALIAMRKVIPLDAHKGMLGKALLICGSVGMAGAATLAARGCLRAGVGKLVVHTPHCNVNILQLSVPEAILSIDAHKERPSQLPVTAIYQAVGIGCGISVNASCATVLRDLLKQYNRPIVVDADAITLLARHREEWLHLLPKNSILTPHAKEAERLVGLYANRRECIEKCSAMAQDAGIIIVVKGHHSAICLPDGSILRCPTGNPGMATGGSGDVLTGILTSLLAQGYAPDEAACLGVWLHGRAGDLAADALSEESLLSGDLPRFIAPAWKELMK